MHFSSFLARLALALAVCALAPPAARAQTALGIPFAPESIAYAKAGLTLGLSEEWNAWGAGVGARFGEDSPHVMGATFTRASINQNGSRSNSYGLRYAYEWFDRQDGTGGSGSLNVGLSQGYALVYNVEGTHQNAHYSTTQPHVGFGASWGLGDRQLRIAPYATLEGAYVFRRLKLYDRKNSLEVTGNDWFAALAAGVTVSIAGHCFVGLEFSSKLNDFDLSGALSLGGYL